MERPCGGRAGDASQIGKSTAISFPDGKELTSPSTPKVMCCYMAPWMCGCTKQMAVLGTVKIEVPGVSAACMVVCGAPVGTKDLEICEEVLWLRQECFWQVCSRCHRLMGDMTCSKFLYFLQESYAFGLAQTQWVTVLAEVAQVLLIVARSRVRICLTLGRLSRKWENMIWMLF